MGNSRQGQHQTTKTDASAKTASKQETTMLREEPQELLSNQALGKILQAQRQSSPHRSSTPMGGTQVKRSSGFRGLSQDLARSSSQGLVIQPKLKLTKAGDRHEQEADRVAAQVVKRINTDPIRKTEATKGDRLMPKATAPTSAPTGTAVTPQFETTLQQQRGQGQSIPEDVREPLEEAFNADFRNVRIHTNERSQQLNHSIQAIAFTTGTDIFFKQGAYQPRSRQGQELLAHELTHVVQQNPQKTAIQRKGAGQIQFSNEPFPESAIFVQEVTQEIRSFSDTWLNSPPSEVEIFPWFKIVNPSIKMEQTTNNCSLDIQGRAELNFSSDLGNIQPKGSFKINYQSQTKKWDYKSENIDLEVTLAEIFHFKADDLQYSRADKALNIKQANLLIPQLNNATAKVENARIDSNGIDWDKVTLNVTDIAVSQYANINAASATIGGAKQQYASEFKGDFGANLGKDNLVKVKADGQLTVKYEKGKWSCPDNNVSIKGTIAKVLEFNASNIQYDHENKRVSIGEAGIKIPDLYNASAKVEKAVIDSNGLDWEKVTLNATDIDLGEYARINNVSATIGGASQEYASEFSGKFGANLGTDNLLEVNAEGQLTVKYEKGKWSCPDNNVTLEGKIAKVLEFNASNIQYDHENTKVTIGEASVSILPLDTTAKVEKARIDKTGIDWDKLNVNITEIKLGEYARINNVSATIGGASQEYASQFSGKFGASLGTSDLVKVDADGQLTVKYEKGQWSCPDNNVSLKGTIANVLEFDASKIQYHHADKTVTIGEASVSISQLNTKAKVEKARIDKTGIDWDKLNVNITEIKLGEYARINDVSATISGASQEYASQFSGKFGASLGTSDLVKVDADGQLTVKYEKGQWSCPDSNVSLKGTIANVLEFDASKIQYHHADKTVTIGEASVSISQLNTKAKVEKARIDKTGIDWDKLNVNITEIKLGEYARINNVSATISGASQEYASEFKGEFGANLGTDNLVEVNAEGQLTVKYEKGKWSCPDNNVTLEGKIAKVLEFNASNIQYDHENTKVTIGEASVSILPLDTTAKVEKARIDKTGIDWDKLNVNITEIKLGEYARINNVSATIGGASQEYASEFSGKFGASLGTSDLVKVDADGQLTVKYEKGQWSCPENNVSLKGTIADVLNFSASDIQYHHADKTVTIGEASVSISQLNTTAKVEKARIDKTGIDWDKLNVKITEVKLGEYARINNVSATISGASQEYASEFKGEFGANLGTSDLVKVDADGQLTVKYEKGQWSCPDNNVSLKGTIANVLEFNASNIQYDHENTKVTIGEASVSILPLDTTAKVEKARIDKSGIDWDKLNVKITEVKLGEYARINDVSATISGASQEYTSEFSGKFGASLGTSDLVKVDADGQLTVKYEKGQWSCPDNNVSLKGTIADVLNFSASDIQYHHADKTVTIGEAGITIPELYNATATVEKARIDSTGLDWDKVKLSATDIALGQYAIINAVSATICGAKQDYASEFSGALGVHLGTSNLAEVNAKGQLTIKNVKGKWSCPDNSVSLKGTIADVLDFDASKIQYHHADKKVTIGQASVTIQQLNDTKASVDNARIDRNGLDWDAIKAQTGDISLGTVLSIKKPALMVEGATTRYSTTVSGGVELHFGEYLNAEGSGKIKLDRSQGKGKGKILVEEAELKVKGSITLPGDSFAWPNISLDYPIVPGVEAGLELGIKGGIGASLQGTIAKQAGQDWNLGINPELHGFLGVDLKAKVGVGSAYIAAIQAFVSGGCKAEFNGGLKLNGLLKYDEETKKVDATKLLSKYYANAEFEASISAGVQAQALYFFTKDLYRIRAKCSLGGGKLEGELEFDQNGKFHIGKPKFSGVIAGEFDKTSIKLEEQSYELIKDADADAILEDAAQKIGGSGEKRKEIINKVKAGYIRSLDEAKKVINKETEKSEKYIKSLEKIDIKIARYNGLIKLAKDLEQEEDSVNSQETDLSKELENEEMKLDKELENEETKLKLDEDLETEVETLVSEDNNSKEKSKSKSRFVSKVKSAAKVVGKGKETLKNKLIPVGVRDKYHAIGDKYEKKKLKVKEAINTKRDSIRIKYNNLKEKKKESFALLKNEARESFPKIADKTSTIKSNASALTKKASSLKAEIKESIKEKTLIKLTELGIKNSKSFVDRIGRLTELQIKYSKKHELHSNFLKSAIEAKSKAEKVLEDVEAAIADLQKLEEGVSMNKLTEMNEQKKAFMNAKNELHKEEVSLEDDFMKQIDDIEKEVATALG